MKFVVSKSTLTVLLTILLAGCAANEAEMKTVDYVDLERFMGDWYVIANIPTFLEKGAHNAVENYALNDDGTIATSLRFGLTASMARKRNTRRRDS